MNSNKTLENELVRLSAHNKEGYSENKNIFQKREIKSPLKLTHTTNCNRKETRQQSQNEKKKEKPIKIEKSNKAMKSNKTKKYEKQMKTIAINYFRGNAEKHEPYLSQLFDLIYKQTKK
jgi:hypothetical protein